MDITWLGHSSFKIKARDGKTVITDPYSPKLGYPPIRLSAQIITVSHLHEGHSYAGEIMGDYRLINGPGEYEIGGILIIGVTTFHDAEHGKIRGKNTVYLVEVDDVAVCHLGDLGHVLTSEQVEEIGQVDVLMLPVGGISTINATRAAEVVRQLEPKLVIPMHYKTEVLAWELEPLDRFLREMGIREINTSTKLNISRSSLPLSTQVAVLDYK